MAPNRGQSEAMQSVSTHARTAASTSTSPCTDSLITAACSAGTARSTPPQMNRALGRVVGSQRYTQESSLSTPRFSTVASEPAFPSGVGIAIASFMTILGVALVKSPSWKHLRESFYSMRQSRQIPCSRCRFHHHNPYMRCAVHPTKAQTSRAIDCSDYWGYEHDEFRH